MPEPAVARVSASQASQTPGVEPVLTKSWDLSVEASQVVSKAKQNRRTPP